jgi:hypothetical protein
MDEDALNRRAQEVQNALEGKFGRDTTQGMIDAVGAQNFDPNFIRQVVQNGAETFQRLGEESLLNVMQRAGPSDPQVRRAEETYNAIRTQQREAWRMNHGRSR